MMILNIGSDGLLTGRVAGRQACARLDHQVRGQGGAPRGGGGAAGALRAAAPEPGGSGGPALRVPGDQALPLLNTLPYYHRLGGCKMQ